MAVYLVTWDLNREKPNYTRARDEFVAALEKFSYIKDTGLDSVRFIDTDWNPTQIREYLYKWMDENDRLVVTRMRSGEKDGWLSRLVWDWINART